jgi:protein-tyrosine phosphatase
MPPRHGIWLRPGIIYSDRRTTRAAHPLAVETVAAMKVPAIGGALPKAPDLQLTDIHTHLLPGVDDGARTTQEALDGLQQMHHQGVSALAFTPHLKASVAGDPSAMDAWRSKVHSAWDSVMQEMDFTLQQILMCTGAEIMLDVPQPDLSDPWCRIGGGTYVLVEFSESNFPPQAERPIEHIARAGLKPIIAHPERYSAVQQGDPVVEMWRDAGAVFAVNAGSLTGTMGKRTRRAALDLLARGYVDMVGSDYHAAAVDRPLEIQAAFELIMDWADYRQAEIMFDANPRRVVTGGPMLPATAITPPSGLRRLARKLSIG